MDIKSKEIIKNSFKNKEEVMKSSYCGCYNCTKIFTPDMIVEYIDNGQTVVCPFCGIDSVLGSTMGYDFNLKFLTKLKKDIFEDDNTIYINKTKFLKYVYTLNITIVIIKVYTFL